MLFRSMCLSHHGTESVCERRCLMSLTDKTTSRRIQSSTRILNLNILRTYHVSSEPVTLCKYTSSAMGYFLPSLILWCSAYSEHLLFFSRLERTDCASRSQAGEASACNPVVVQGVLLPWVREAGASYTFISRIHHDYPSSSGRARAARDFLAARI